MKPVSQMHRTHWRAFGARDKNWVENMESKVVRPVFGRDAALERRPSEAKLDPET